MTAENRKRTMIHFIPAWYTDPDHWWAERIYWYREKKGKYDGFLSQLRMFLHEGEEVSIFNLAHYTGFNRLRFSEDLGNVGYTSIFDILQNIDLTECAAFSFKDLPWKYHMEWIYTPFLIWGYMNGERKVRIEFAKSGDLTEINFYDQEYIYMKYRMDERGFASIVFHYQKNNPPYAYYLNPSGQVQFREDLLTGEVVIAVDAEHAFKKHRYNSISELVNEALQERLSVLGTQDTLIVAAHPRHNSLFLNKERPYRTILFIEGEHTKCCSFEEMQAADLLVTDSEWERNRIMYRYPSLSTECMVIAPVDARLGWGRSSETKLKKIFLHADITDDLLGKILEHVAEFLSNDPDVELYMVAELSSGKGADALKEELITRIETLSDLHVDREEEKPGENSDIEETPEEEPDKVYIRLYKELQELEDVLNDCRLLIDLGSEPSELLQIVGISMGIPQIHLVESRYIEHKKDGYVLDGIDELPTAIKYYLYNLQNWNEAFLNCVHKVETYSGKAIVTKWKQHIEAVRRYDGRGYPDWTISLE